jgi:hypothetical protein
MKKVIIVGAGAQGNVISGVLAKAPVVSPRCGRLLGGCLLRDGQDHAAEQSRRY